MSEAFKLAPHKWALLRSLLEEALALPASQRADWLAALDDQRAQGLKPRLASLLSHAADDAPATAARRMQTLPKIETGQFAPWPGHVADKPGDAIGPYRLIRELGSGGMGSVWLAERTDMLQGRQVALKLPHGAWKRAGLAERLGREREILATLEHPHIARLYDAGLAADGQPWLALEYVQGERIDVHCRAKALPVAARLRLFLQVAQAVAHAHALLVVHRDLKPANILVTDAGDVKLLDFGIAKLLQVGVAEETDLTRDAGRALTPEYASPEQLSGRSIGTASDVYSLGVVLFELLVEARPFQAVGGGRAALEQALAAGDAPRPSVMAPVARRAALRGELDVIVLKALKREPNQRYATVAAFADDVQRHLQRRPVLAQPDSMGYRLRSWVRRHRVAAAAGVAVGAALLLGTGVSLWQANVARQQQQRAEAVKDFIATIFREAAPHGGSGSIQLSALDLLKLADQRMRAASLTDPTVRVELSALLAEGLMSFGDLGSAEPLLSLAAAAASAGLPAHHAQALRVAVLQAQVHRLQGRGEQARVLLDATLPVLRAQARDNPRAEPRELVAALTHRALAAFEQAAYQDAERFAAEGAEMAAKRLVAGDELRISSPLVLALAHRYMQKFELARDMSATALQAAIARHGERPPHPRVAEARTVHGRALADTGAVAEGVAAIDRAIADLRQLYGESNPQLGMTLQNVVAYRIDIGELAAAERDAAAALRILSAVAQPESLTYAATLAAWAHARLAQRDAATALPDLERAAALLERLIGPAKDATLLARAGRAQALVHLGRASEALAEAESLRAVVGSASAADVSAAVRARIAVVGGSAARRSGDAVAARSWLQPVIAGDDPAPRLQRERMRARVELGLALRDLGETAAARSALQLALQEADRLEIAPTPMRAEAAQALAALPASATTTPLR